MFVKKEKMKKYKKLTPRLSVQYVDSTTEEILFEINDRTWMNVGELLTNEFVDRIVKAECGNNINKLPEKLMVLVVGEYELM